MLNEEQLTIVALRKLVVKKIRENVEEKDVQVAFRFAELLDKLPSYNEEEVDKK